MDFSKYQAELAKSNRSQCRETSCKQNIGKGELRLGYQGGDYYSWYHAACCFKTFANRYIRNTAITSVEQIQYYDQLDEDSKALLCQLIDGTYQPPAEVPRHNSRPKRGGAAANIATATAVADDIAVTSDTKKKRRVA